MAAGRADSREGVSGAGEMVGKWMWLPGPLLCRPTAEHPDGGWLPACGVQWPGPKTARCRAEVRVNPRAPAVGSEEKQVFTCTDSEASLQEAPPASTA